MKKTVIEQLSEAQETIKGLETDLAQANSANKTAAEDLSKLNKELADAKHGEAVALNSLKDEQTKAAGLEATVKDLQAQVDKLKADAKTAEQIAGERLGNVAAEPVGKLAATATSKDELWAQYHALQSPVARRDFWMKHKQQLS